MNRIFKYLTILAAILLLASCTTKSCRCYKLEQWGNVRVSETYIDENTPCSDLGYDYPNPDDSSFRYCVDIDYPEIDTMDVVRMFWGH